MVMDKPLSDKDKNADSEQIETKGKEQVPSESGGGSAAANPVTEKNQDITAASDKDKSQQIELSKDSWDKALDDPKNKPWMNDPKSRLAVRAFSRGVMGAAFFVAGGMYARKSLAHYDVTKSFMEQQHRNPITFLAKLVDTAVGVPIEATVKAITGDAVTAKKSVLFRSTFYPNKITVDGKRMWGRSLGHEVVDITFDFFCASVGDAFGRDIAGFFDPNVKKTWIDDKGHVNFPQAIHEALSAVTRYVTYNGGEDWAVAIPYAYFMKGQREIINKISPGWKYDFDQAKNGGSFKLGGNPLDEHGRVNSKFMPTITGSYSVESAVDLQSRFTVYNIGTLMYREVYDYMKNRGQGHTDHLYGDPTRPDKKTTILEKASELAKWTARSAIKGLIIMTPSVPFFWITRSNQNKHRGLFIHDKHGMMTRRRDGDSHNNYNQPVEVGDYHHAMKSDSPEAKALLKKDVYFSQFSRSSARDRGIPYGRIGPMDPHHANPSMWLDPTDPLKSGLPGTSFHPYSEGQGIGGRIFDKIGHGQHEVAKKLTPVAKWADDHSGAYGAKIKQALGGFGEDGSQSFKRFTHPFVRASMSYTPYMYAKAEFANMWDNGATDMAAERLIDGVAALNWSEFKAGVGEVWNAVLHKPMDDPRREIEAQHRIEADTSAPEIFSDIQFKKQKHLEIEEIKRKEKAASFVEKVETESKSLPASSWQERVVAGRSEDKPEVGANKPKNYAEQEAMRKALEEMQPPTNSIN